MNSFYHFTSTKALDQIQEMGYMQPKRRMIKQTSESIPSITNESAIYGLVKEEDPRWNNLEFKKGASVMDDVLSDIYTDQTYEIALLRIDATNLKDVFVADWGFHLAEDYLGDCSHTNDKTLQRVKEQYGNSLIPLSEYNDEEMGFTLPEVVCFSQIPVQNIEIIFTEIQDKYRNTLREKYGKEMLPKSWEAPQKIAKIDFEEFLSMD